MVYDAARQFIHLIPEEDRDDVLAACWTHDLIEDCRESYNDVLKVTNERVAELTYALTNEKGKTRKERANFQYYYGIRKVKHAPFVKACDRLANFSYSITAGSMADKYRKEMDHFIKSIFKLEYIELFAHLKKLADESND